VDLFLLFPLIFYVCYAFKVCLIVSHCGVKLASIKKWCTYFH